MRRRALLIGVPGSGLNVSLAMERLGPVLARLGFSSVAKVVGPRASRREILAGLDRLIAAAEPGDAALVYYFGHGGRVRLTGLPEPWEGQVRGYVTCTRETRGGPWEAVLDHELSRRLAALDARCGNVTAIFDCCFSGELGRDDDPSPSDLRVEEASPWVHEALAPVEGVRLALDAHPSIVRLCGASAKREAYAAERSGRHIGRLTEALLGVLAEAGDEWTRLCWATAGLRMREHVIAALGMEGQWINLAGPRARRLFSAAAVAVPGLVPYLPGEVEGRGWLRVGWQQGVAPGDRWVVHGARVDDEGRPEVLAEGVVESVGRNRAELVLETGADRKLPAGSPASLRRTAQPMPVEVPASLLEALRSSAWIEAAGEGPARARVVASEGALTVEDLEGARPPVCRADDAAGRAAVVAILEDRARLEVLRRCLAEPRPSPCPLRWSWRRVDEPEPRPQSGSSLTAGERIVVELRYEGSTPQPWFVAVLLVDPAGRLHLLSARMPEGLELGPGDRETLGVRLGRAEQGIELRWPEGMAAGEGPVSVWVLASRRPQCLEHLVASRPLDDDAALALQGLIREPQRGKKPEHARGAAWAVFDLTLRSPDPEPVHP
ncbi:MAG: caspase family protein [Myxococcales bacterium]|nr:caspase family protein [Myxococcales bacterium]MCB9716786.1 caspase family protein [Myxococcales bacterium]